MCPREVVRPPRYPPIHSITQPRDGEGFGEPLGGTGLVWLYGGGGSPKQEGCLPFFLGGGVQQTVDLVKCLCTRLARVLPSSRNYFLYAF